MALKGANQRWPCGHCHSVFVLLFDTIGPNHKPRSSASLENSSLVLARLPGAFRTPAPSANRGINGFPLVAVLTSPPCFPSRIYCTSSYPDETPACGEVAEVIGSQRSQPRTSTTSPTLLDPIVRREPSVTVWTFPLGLRFVRCDDRTEPRKAILKCRELVDTLPAVFSI